MNVRHRVTLTQYERDELGALLGGGKHPARKLKRAQILLAADAGVSDEDIAASVGAREQGALSWELRAATSLARALRSLGLATTAASIGPVTRTAGRGTSALAPPRINGRYTNLPCQTEINWPRQAGGGQMLKP
jgi:hypothetical protein